LTYTGLFVLRIATARYGAHPGGQTVQKLPQLFPKPE
jgi:hypothetical protein